MNVYVCIRLVLHCLLFLINLSALTTASLFINALKNQGHKASAGSVLVILGFIFYAIATVFLWSELFISNSKYSKNKNETYVVPVLFGFQLIGAIVCTADATQIKITCGDQSISVALVIFSWMSTFSLVLYFLIIMIVGLYHYVIDENVWDATPLAYNWFPLPPSTSNEKTEVASRNESASVYSVVTASGTANNGSAEEPSSLSDQRRPAPPPVPRRSGSNFLDLDLESGALNAPLPTFSPFGSRSLPTRRPLSSWMPTPVDPSTKTTPTLLPRTTGIIAMTSPDYANAPRSRNAGSTTNSGEEIGERDFEDVELGAPSATATTPNSSTALMSSNDTRDSLLPAWVKRMRPAIRGIGLPFPVSSARSSASGTVTAGTRPLQIGAAGKRPEIRRIDTAVSPTPFPRYI